MATRYVASCDCGWSGRYNSQPVAEYAMSRHSCQRQRERTAAAAARLAKTAAVDRTPQPCLHPHARHIHGTRTCYVMDRCRCWHCSAANTTAEEERRRQKAYGRYQAYVDVGPARQHLAALVAQGMGPKRITQVSGIAHGVISSVLYGKHLGRGQTRQQKRIHPDTAARILAVRFDPANPVIADPEPTQLARQRLRALVALGWTMSDLGRQLGKKTPYNMSRLITSDDRMQWGTVREIDTLYARLSMTLPPATNQHQRITVSRSKRYARDHGWLPPLDLDAQLDDQAPDDGPDIDEQAIWRLLHGDTSIRLTGTEKREAIRRWQDMGRSLNELEQTTGWDVWRYLRSDLEEAS